MNTPGGGRSVTCLMAPPFPPQCHMLPPVLERKRPVGSQVFVASSQGAASGFESEKCRQMKPGDKAVFSCLHTPLLRQGKPKQWDRPGFRCVLVCWCSWWQAGVIEAK